MHSLNFVGTYSLVVALVWSASSAIDATAQPRPAPSIDQQFTITLPDGWSVYDQDQALSGKSSPFGLVLFSAEPVTKPGEAAADPMLLARADTGDVASFFVDRKRADKGMTCTNMSRSAVYGIGISVIKDPAVGLVRRSFLGATPPRHTDIEVGGCKGVRFVVDAQKNSPEKHTIIDVRAVSDGNLLYLFSLRNRAANYSKNLEVFENALASLRFLDAR